MEQDPVGGGVAFADGYQSGRIGAPRTANPHKGGTAGAAAWLDGWNEGSTKRAWIDINGRIGNTADTG
jgi:ribosome modulation factor